MSLAVSHTRLMPMLLISFVLVTQSVLLAQTHRVTEVYNAVTFDARLSPGSRAVVRHQLGWSDFDVVVEVGGRRSLILAVAGIDAIGIQLPMEVAPGPTTLVVTSRGVTTAPFPITLDPTAPAILGPITHCPFLQPGDATLLAVGLGATDPLIPAGATVPSDPPASTMLRPSIKIGEQPAEVVRSVLLPGRNGRNEGFYQVTFKVPPGLPHGLHRLELTIGGRTSWENLRSRSAATTLAPGVP